MPQSIGIPKEVFPGERRVVTVPDVVLKLMKRGFAVAVQSGAGEVAASTTTPRGWCEHRSRAGPTNAYPFIPPEGALPCFGRATSASVGSVLGSASGT